MITIFYIICKGKSFIGFAHENGYPYVTDYVQSARLFRSEDDAKKMIGMHKVRFNDSMLTDCTVRQLTYEVK